MRVRAPWRRDGARGQHTRAATRLPYLRFAAYAALPCHARNNGVLTPATAYHLPQPVNFCGLFCSIAIFQ